MFVKNSVSEHGFSLLEVLVGFLILVASLTIILQIYHRGTQAAVLGNDYAEAVLIAQSKLASVGIEDSLDIGQYSGEVNDRYRWVLEVTPFEDEYDYSVIEASHKIVPRHVSIEISWKRLGKLRTIQLHSLRLMPSR